MPRPRFSVIMANYNNADYLDIAIRSVLAQSYADWELVIIDDASTDESVARIQAYLSDPRIRLFEKPHNAGYTQALIDGLDKASSEIVGILDSDDALAPEAIEKVLSAYAANAGAGLILTQMMVCDSELKPLLRTVNTPKHLKEPLLWMRGPTAFRTFTMAAYRLTSGLDRRMDGGEDSDLIFKLEEVAPTHRIDEPLYLYRQLASSQSKAARSYLITYRCIALGLYNAYRRRQGTSVPNLPRIVVLAWLVAAVRYCLELRQRSQALLFAMRALRIAPTDRASYSALIEAIKPYGDVPSAARAAGFKRLRFYPVREFQSSTGNRRADGIVCELLTHRPGYCLFGGDYLIFEDGKYRVTFEMIIDCYRFAEDPVIIIDVYENLQTKMVLAERRITRADLAGRAQSLELEFSARQGQRVEFRVYWEGQCQLTVAGVTLDMWVTSQGNRDAALFHSHGELQQ